MTYLLRPRGGKPLLLDGGLGSYVELLGGETKGTLWVSQSLVPGKASILETAHRDFFDAGADIAITASYQAHDVGFAEMNIEASAASAAALSVHIARNAASGDKLIAGSIGCFGASLGNGEEYTGNYSSDVSEDFLREWHIPRIRALVDAKCDILACETIPCGLEARALVSVLEEIRHPAWITFACKSGTLVNSGEKFEDCIRIAAESEWVVGTGVNCTAPEYVSELIAIAKQFARADQAIIAYPNIGNKYEATSQSWTGQGVADDRFVELALQWVALGASVVGGCCGTTPATIRLLASALHLIVPE